MSIEKILKIEGSSITWTNKQIAKMIDNEKISFKNIVQRGFVWDKARMSELIWSIIMGYPIPSIYAVRGDTDNEKVKIFDVMDGQQRLTTIYKFLNDEFPLTKLEPIPYLDDEGKENTIDITGMKFSELDEEFQDIIKDSTISVRYYDNLEQYQRAEMFRRLNNGKPLTSKIRTLSYSKDIEGLLYIGSHPMFEKMLSKSALVNKTQATIVMKIWCMLNQDIKDVTFETKKLNVMIKENVISKEEREELNNVFDYIVNVHESLESNGNKMVAKKLYTEIHLVSLIPYVKQAMETNVSEAMFAEWLIHFFRTENLSEINEKYDKACLAGVARNGTIVARHEALGESYMEYFKLKK